MVSFKVQLHSLQSFFGLAHNRKWNVGAKNLQKSPFRDQVNPCPFRKIFSIKTARIQTGIEIEKLKKLIFNFLIATCPKVTI